MQNREDFIKSRVLEEARYFIDNNSTIRETALVFGISKSTVFIDLSQRLPDYSHFLSLQVNTVLNQNKEQRAIRGGIAKAKKIKSKKN